MRKLKQQTHSFVCYEREKREEFDWFLRRKFFKKSEGKKKNDNLTLTCGFPERFSVNEMDVLWFFRKTKLICTNIQFQKP